MSVFKRPGQTIYSFDFRYRGKRFSGSTGCTTKREAEKYEEAERKRLAAGLIDLKAPMTFHAAAARYWDEVGQFHVNSDDTLRALDWLELEIGKSTLLSTVTDSIVARLVAKRRGEAGRNDLPVSPATVNRSVCEPLRAILIRARKTWKVSVDDIEWKQHFLKESQERVREASAKEEKAFLDNMRGDYAPALRFALLTGCRRAEIVGLRWGAVDFFNREFTVVGKGDLRRTIPMSKAVYDLLWKLKDDHADAVFTYQVKRPAAGRPRGSRQPITMEGFKTEWRRTKGRAKVEDFKFHDTRHTAATRLVRATGNLRLAQRLLGHSDIKTTTRYAHVTHEDLRAGLEAATPTKTPTKGGAVAANKLRKKGKSA